MTKKSETVTTEQLFAMIQKLQAENEALKKAPTKAERPRIRVTDKGGIAITPKGSTTFYFYADQWAKIEPMVKEINAFVKANADKLISEADRKARAKANR